MARDTYLIPDIIIDEDIYGTCKRKGLEYTLRMLKDTDEFYEDYTNQLIDSLEDEKKDKERGHNLRNWLYLRLSLQIPQRL